VLRGPLTISGRFDALWIDTETSWALDRQSAPWPQPRRRFRLLVSVGALLLACLAAGAFGFLTA